MFTARDIWDELNDDIYNLTRPITFSPPSLPTTSGFFPGVEFSIDAEVPVGKGGSKLRTKVGFGSGKQQKWGKGRRGRVKGKVKKKVLGVGRWVKGIVSEVLD